MKHLLVIISAFLLAKGLALAGQVPLSYDAADNLNAAEGTIECWIMTPVAIDEVIEAHKQQPYLHLLSLFACKTRRGEFNVIAHARRGGGPFLHAAQRSEIGPMQPVSAQVKLGAGQWHHVAIVWKSATLSVYFDGQLVGARAQNEGYAVLFASLVGRLAVGSQVNESGNAFAVDDLRLSLVARLPEELGWHGPLKPDIHTSLLDTFDTAEDGSLAPPAVNSAGRARQHREAVTIVPGKFGQALMLQRR